MKLIKVIPNIFYSDIRVGLNLFVECLGFKILYNHETLYIIERDSVTLHLKEDDEFAKKGPAGNTNRNR